MAIPVVVGVDVGGTNTDAVVLSKVTSQGQRQRVLAEDKHLTTSDVTTGVRNAVLTVLRQARDAHGELLVTQVNIGTTHFVNAVVQHKHLSRVSVLRLCGPASRAVPPFSDFPPALKRVIYGSGHFLKGGHRVDGREIDPVDSEEVKAVVEEVKVKGVTRIVVCGIFSPTRTDHEEQVGKLVQELYPEATVTLSHTIGQIGLLERENAAILNEALKELCVKTISGFRNALDEMGLSCPMFLTQNDGTVISEQQAMDTPVFTFASGPTNSMRGAAFLCQVENAVVVDIGGTTTDVGVLKNGFPREATTDVRVAGVRTNFRMPDVRSVGLGGGSYVRQLPDGRALVGPLSAGYNLKQEALVFGSREENATADSGRRVTATDMAVAAGLMELGDATLVSQLPTQHVQAAIARIRQIVEDAIDSVRVSDEPLPVILVGGGSTLLDRKCKLRGASEIMLSEHYGVANAIGAALSQVSGNVDSVVMLESFVHDDVMQQHVQQVKQDLPPEATQVKAVGDLSTEVSSTRLSPWQEPPGLVISETDVSKQTRSVTGQSFDPTEVDVGVTWAGLEATRPHVDSQTGEWILSAWDVECIAVGAGILGGGGGGNPNVGRVRARAAVENGMKIRIISPERMLARGSNPDTDLLISLGFMGAPVVSYEQTTSGMETPTAFRCLQELYSIGRYADGDLHNKDGVDIQHKDGVVYIDDYQPPHTGHDSDTGTGVGADVGGIRVTGVMCIEVGGMNTLEPLMVSAILGVPVVDADGMGRAFPELQMFLPYINGQPPYPTALADDKGRRAVILRTENAKQVEDHFRYVSMTMGSAAGLALAPVTASNLKHNTVLRSFSRVWAIGDCILRARRAKSNPLQALIAEHDAHVLLTGKIRDVTRTTSGAFNRGRVSIEGVAYTGTTSPAADSSAQELVQLVLDFQNENLVVRRVDEGGQTVETLAVVPDVISILDVDTAEPIPTEEVRYGQRVAVVTVPAPPAMTTPRALQVVGPAAFGYTDVTYKPLGKYREPEPLAPV